MDVGNFLQLESISIERVALHPTLLKSEAIIEKSRVVLRQYQGFGSDVHADNEPSKDP